MVVGTAIFEDMTEAEATDAIEAEKSYKLVSVIQDATT